MMTSFSLLPPSLCESAQMHRCEFPPDVVARANHYISDVSSVGSYSASAGSAGQWLILSLTRPPPESPVTLSLPQSRTHSLTNWLSHTFPQLRLQYHIASTVTHTHKHTLILMQPLPTISLISLSVTIFPPICHVLFSGASRSSGIPP